MTQALFEALLTLLQQPVQSDRGLKTDNSILLIYPPERELDFREQLLDSFVPAVKARGIPLQLVDLTGSYSADLARTRLQHLRKTSSTTTAGCYRGSRSTSRLRFRRGSRSWEA
jgi:hypothetical protein